MNVRFASLLLAIASLAHGQSVPAPTDSYHFKNAYLGMSLADFRVAMAGDKVWINPGKATWRGTPSKKDAREVATPLCTDVFTGFPGVDRNTLRGGEIVCDASPGMTNQHLVEVKGYPVKQILYRFLNEKLFEIDVWGSSSDFPRLKAGFIEKYGEPDKRGEEQFQNVFGARWNGRTIFWQHGAQGIFLSEGSGAGPGQNPDSPYEIAVICDPSLGPKANASPVDF